MKKITAYETIDGILFTSKEAADKHVEKILSDRVTKLRHDAMRAGGITDAQAYKVIEWLLEDETFKSIKILDLLMQDKTVTKDDEED